MQAYNVTLCCPKAFDQRHIRCFWRKTPYGFLVVCHVEGVDPDDAVARAISKVRDDAQFTRLGADLPLELDEVVEADATKWPERWRSGFILFPADVE